MILPAAQSAPPRNAPATITNPTTTPVACITWRRSGHCTRCSSAQLPRRNVLRRETADALRAGVGGRRHLELSAFLAPSRSGGPAGDRASCAGTAGGQRLELALLLGGLEVVDRVSAPGRELRLDELGVRRGVTQRARSSVALGAARVSGAPGPSVLRPSGTSVARSRGHRLRATSVPCSFAIASHAEIPPDSARFAVSGVALAPAAVFAQLESLGVVPLTLVRLVVPALAFLAGEGGSNPNISAGHRCASRMGVSVGGRPACMLTHAHWVPGASVATPRRRVGRP